MEKKIGDYSFIVGVIIALVLGLIPAEMLGAAHAWLVSLLVILGILVGLLNVTGKETKDFLLVAAVLIIALYASGQAVATMGEVWLIGGYIVNLLTQILAFVVPATVVVALKEVWALAQTA